MAISHRERFFGLPNPAGGYYAPAMIGAPEFTTPADYTVFKKSKEEKAEAKLVKGWHKQELKKAYPNGIGRKLNIPAKTLSKSVINTF